MSTVSGTQRASLLHLGTWPTIIAVYLYGICGASTVAKLIPLVGDMAHDFGVDPAAFGWLVALIALPAAILAIPSGLVVDRFGPRRVLLVATLTGVVSNLLYYTAHSIPILQAARLLEGAAIVHIYTAGPVLMMATPDAGRRTSAMTLWATYAPVGTALGLTIAGFFAETAGWRGNFLVHAGIFSAAALLTFALPNPPAMGARPPIGKQLADLKDAYSRPMLLLLAFAFFLMISMGLGANVAFPRYYVRLHGIPMHEATATIAAVTLAMIVGSISVGVLLRGGAKPHRLYTIIAVIGFAAGVLCFWPGLGMPGHTVAMAAWFFLTGAGLAVIMATLPVVAEPERRGAAAALINQAGAVATFLNPPIWLGLAEGGHWSGFVLLLAIGWTLSVGAMWLMALRATRPAGAKA